MKKLLSLLIVLTLITSFVMAEGNLPDVQLGTISTETTESDTAKIQIPERPKAVKILEDGVDTGFGINMLDVESEYEDYAQTYANQQNFNPVFDGVFLKFDIANYKAEIELLDIYAIKNNVAVDPLVLEQEVNDIVSQISANDQYKQQVITNYRSMEDFYQFVKMARGNEMLREKVLGIVAPLTDEAIEEAFVQNQSDLVLQYEQVKVKHILVDTLEEAEKIKTDINAGTISFEDAANKYSTDPGNAGTNNGELGWVARGKTVPEFEAVAFSTKPGEISVPVKSQYGFHLILVEDKKSLRDLSDFKKMTEEYNSFTQKVQQSLLAAWYKKFMEENKITFEYQDYMNSVQEFAGLYTQASQTGDYSPMVTYVVDFKPASFNDRAFYEVAIQSVLQLADQVPGTVSDDQKTIINAARLANLKAMSTHQEVGFAALSRYYALNPSDTRMAIKFFDQFISEALKVAQDEDFMTAYGDQVIAQLMQAYPGLQRIGADTSADSKDRVVAYMYMIRINKIAGNTEDNQEVADKILEIDPSNKEVLDLITD